MKKSIYTLVFVLAGCLAAQASLVGYTNTFSTASSTNGWMNVGSVSTTIISRVTYPGDYDDGDTSSILAYTVGMTLTGDGVYNDGALKLDLVNATKGDEAMGYTLSGTMAVGETVTFSGTVGAGSAYCQFDAQIWNVTDNILLATTPAGSDRVFGTSYFTNGIGVDFSVSYTGLAGDAGDVIQVRINDNGAWTASNTRDIYVDNVMVTTIPEPASLSLMVIGAFFVRWIAR